MAPPLKETPLLSSLNLKTTAFPHRGSLPRFLSTDQEQGCEVRTLPAANPCPLALGSPSLGSCGYSGDYKGENQNGLPTKERKMVRTERVLGIYRKQTPRMLAVTMLLLLFMEEIVCLLRQSPNFRRLGSAVLKSSVHNFA